MKSNWWYKPPCKGGDLIVVFADGSEGSTFDVPNMDEMQSNLAALQKQTPEWYENLKALTGHPGGRAGYWGESHDENGNRVATLPSDKEWASAYEELWTAQVTASTMGGTVLPHDHDRAYAAKNHPHVVPEQTI